MKIVVMYMVDGYMNNHNLIECVGDNTLQPIDLTDLGSEDTSEISKLYDYLNNIEYDRLVLYVGDRLGDDLIDLLRGILDIDVVISTF